MSEQPCQVPQNPVKVDLRKVNTPERLERLRLAREVRAKNRLAQEEKRMELAKQMILASAGVPEKKTKTSPDDKKLKWEARKAEILEEFSRKFAEANAEAALKKAKEPVPEPSESEFSDMEEPPAKRQKRSSKSKKSSKGAAAPVKSKSAKKSSSTTASNAYERGKKRRSVPPAVMSESSESESNESSDVEQEHVLKLW